MAQRTYEIVYIVNPDASEDTLNSLSENFQSIITTQGGTIVKAETMGKRRFAYPIGRLKEGTYQLIEVEGTGKEIAELERRMRVNDAIVRYMTVRVDEDRQRAEKFRARRERVAAKRGGVGKATSSVGDNDDTENPVEDTAPVRGQGGQGGQAQHRRFRRRKVSQLMRDKVDIIDFKDVKLLEQYIPERGKIMPRRLSSNTAIHQRMLAEAIKRARILAMLPFATD